MTPVFSHGRLRLYLLHLLHEQPRHGYELIRLLEDRFLGTYAPSAGTIYPRLARLEAEGLVTHDLDAGRKVFRLTEAGEEELASRAHELDEVEDDIAQSVRDRARDVREDVHRSARDLREELRGAARELRREQRHNAREGQSRDRENATEDWRTPCATPGSEPPATSGRTRRRSTGSPNLLRQRCARSTAASNDCPARFAAAARAPIERDAVDAPRRSSTTRWSGCGEPCARTPATRAVALPPG